MARRYSQEVHDFIRENVAGRTARELTDLVNERFGIGMTASAMHAYKTNHHLRSGTPCGHIAGQPSKVFPQEVCDYIRANFYGVGHKEMADRLNELFGTSYTQQQINSFYCNHKLNSGRTGRFEKGSVPANKGKKWDEFMSPEAQARSRATCYKKGNLPSDTKPIGWERIDRDGYTYVKVCMRPSRTNCNDNFVAKHRLLWERAHGPIPPDHVVIFKDGDKQNFALENLQCVPRATVAVMNKRGLFSTDPALTESGVYVAEVLQGLTAAKKKMKGARKK